MINNKQSFSEREKTLILNNLPLLINYQDIDHNVIWVNERASRYVPGESSDLQGRKCYDIFYKREETCEGCPIEVSWKSEESQIGEVKSSDDSVWEVRGKPVKDEEGNIIGAVETIFDITEQKLMKEKLKDSEERYRRLFETAQDGMLILDAETGRIEDANPYIKNLLGFSKEDLVGKELWQIGAFRDVAENKERFQELVEEGYMRYEDLPLETKSGGEASVEFVSNTYMAGGKRVVQCNIRDTTARKEAEEREKFLHSLLRHDVKNKSQIVKGYLQILKDYELSDEVLEYIEKAEKATDEGVDLIEKVTRLGEIKERNDISAVKLGSVLEKVTSEFEDQLQEKEIDISI
ncbi:MAG: PAS domain S-box protein, partial [Thermoplasmatota archaeon]